VTRRPASGPAHLVEAYFDHWLRHSDIGRACAEKFGFDAAMDYLWENLNAGFLKLEGDANGFTGIAPCVPPKPPLERMARPVARKNGDA
jgi:hypothetical protein